MTRKRSIKDIEEAITQACCGKCSSHMNDSAVRVAGGRLPNAVGPHALCEASAAEIEVQSRSVDHATERFRVGGPVSRAVFRGEVRGSESLREATTTPRAAGR